MEIKEIDRKSANKIIITRKPLGRFWFKEDKHYIGIHNLDGSAWVEQFETKEDCFEYLD